MKAWHFLPAIGQLANGGGPVKLGEWLQYEGDLILCQQGYHASRRLIDALNYAPGPIACRVEVAGHIIKGDDKFVAQRRRVIVWCDATEVLRRFARPCALDVVHLWDAPDVVVQYLNTGDEPLRAAAWAAAGAAARDAAGAAARDAAGAAARSAWAAAWGARAAARGARAAAWGARDAAGAAAGAAARSAWAAARAKQNRRLTAMISAELRVHGEEVPG